MSQNNIDYSNLTQNDVNNLLYYSPSEKSKSFVDFLHRFIAALIDGMGLIIWIGIGIGILISMYIIPKIPIKYQKIATYGNYFIVVFIWYFLAFNETWLKFTHNQSRYISK
jgi:hypothetical protein